MKRTYMPESVDEHGRRIGYLTPEEFAAIGEELFGSWGWQSSLSRGTGITASTIQRYLRGDYPIPLYVATLMELLATIRRHGLPLPEMFNVEEAGRTAA